jgi:hypothetical protein
MAAYNNKANIMTISGPPLPPGMRKYKFNFIYICLTYMEFTGYSFK